MTLANELSPIPPSWVAIAPPVVPDGMEAVYRRTGWEFRTPVYPPEPPPATPKYRKVLSATEWVETWSSDEWRQLKTAAQGTTAVAKRLDQLLDAVKLTGSFNLESQMATNFYNFLETNGYITPQRRAVLTQGILET